MLEVSVSSMPLPGSQTGETVSLRSRSSAQAGALPEITAWVAVFTVFSSAMRNASRLPLPLKAPAPTYSSTTSGNGGWNSSGPISNV